MSEEYYAVPMKFCRERDECTNTIYCLCVRHRDRYKHIAKVHPAFPRPSYGAVDNEARQDNAKKLVPEITHLKAIMESDAGVTIMCWKEVNGEIDFGKGVWKV